MPRKIFVLQSPRSRINVKIIFFWRSFIEDIIFSLVNKKISARSMNFPGLCFKLKLKTVSWVLTVQFWLRLSSHWELFGFSNWKRHLSCKLDECGSQLASSARLPIPITSQDVQAIYQLKPWLKWNPRSHPRSIKVSKVKRQVCLSAVSARHTCTCREWGA